MTFRLSIVIPVFNKFNFTKACLDDLFRLPADHEIIVVDNGSSDDTVSLTDVKDTRFQYVRFEENKGFAEGCNGGYAVSRAPNVMFLNNDVRVQKDFDSWTSPILASLERDSRGLVGPTMGVLTPEFNFVKECSYIEGLHWYMSGWNITADRKVWDALTLPGDEGPFSSEFGKAYFEDVDLSFRARQSGFTFDIVPVPVTHFGKMTSRSLNLSELYGTAKKIFINKWAGKSL